MTRVVDKIKLQNEMNEKGPKSFIDGGVRQLERIAIIADASGRIVLSQLLYLLSRRDNLGDASSSFSSMVRNQEYNLESLKRKIKEREDTLGAAKEGWEKGKYRFYKEVLRGKS